MIGPLTPEQKDIFSKNPRFIGMKFPEISKTDTIERKYLGKISKKALSFMKTILKMDPSDRLTVDELLAHPYLEGSAEVFGEANDPVPLPQT